MLNQVLHRLEKEGIDPAQFSSAQVLCLPENLFSATNGDELLETTDQDALAKNLRNSGVSVFTFMDAGRDLAALGRRSGDIWLGLLWIRDIAIMPILVTVIGNSITKAVEGLQKRASRFKTGEKVQIEILIEEADGSSKSLKYSGDGETLINILKSIRPDEDR